MSPGSGLSVWQHRESFAASTRRRFESFNPREGKAASRCVHTTPRGVGAGCLAPLFVDNLRLLTRRMVSGETPVLWVALLTYRHETKPGQVMHGYRALKGFCEILPLRLAMTVSIR